MVVVEVVVEGSPVVLVVHRVLVEVVALVFVSQFPGSTMTTRDRFIRTAAAAGIPFDTVGYVWPYAVTYIPGTAQPQIDAGTAFIAAFDASDAATAAYSANQAAETALATNAAFLAIASPTNAQAVAQVQALTRQNTRVIQLLVSLIDS
jgi:hypothetical protein